MQHPTLQLLTLKHNTMKHAIYFFLCLFIGGYIVRYSMTYSGIAFSDSFRITDLTTSIGLWGAFLYLVINAIISEDATR